MATTIETKWTPGPWTITGASARTVWAGEAQIAVIDDPALSYDEQRANARIVAAAPDMAEALRTTRSNIVTLNACHADKGIAQYDAWLAVVDAALAKAEGR